MSLGRIATTIQANMTGIFTPLSLLYTIGKPQKSGICRAIESEAIYHWPSPNQPVDYTGKKTFPTMKSE